MSETATGVRPQHVLVAVAQDGAVRNYTLVDATKEARPVLREVAYRAVAARPDLAGNAAALALRQDGTDIVFEAREPGAGESSAPLAGVAVSVHAFGGIAESLAKAAGLEGRFTYYALVCAPDAPVLETWSPPGAGEGGIEWVSGPAAPDLLLPKELATGAFPRTRIVDPAGSWHRAVFSRQAFREFVSAASNESEKERGWIGVGEVHVTPEACRTVVRELREIPAAESSSHHLHTRGRDFHRLHGEIGAGRLAAFLHLHPTGPEGGALYPEPSSEDLLVAYDFLATTALPPVFPIGRFGAESTSDLSAHAFVGGVLTRIQLEILP